MDEKFGSVMVAMLANKDSQPTVATSIHTIYISQISAIASDKRDILLHLKLKRTITRFDY